MKIVLALLSILPLTVSPAVAAPPLSGIADVIDGDTIAIRGVQPRIRLYGIDAPEGRQTCDDAGGRRYLCGSRSAEALSSIIGRSGRVECTEMDRDRYGQIVAVCKSSGLDVSSELVKRGWAVEYRQYSDGRYSTEEADARRGKRGMWVGTFVPPSDWRRGAQ